MILQPMATIDMIREALMNSQTDPIDLSRNYLAKVKRKIMGERMHRSKGWNETRRIAEIEDKKQLIDQRLWSEAQNMKNPGVVRVMALQQLLKNEFDLLERQKASGAFAAADEALIPKRPELSEQQIDLVLGAMEAWRIIPEIVPKLRVIEAGPEAVTHTPSSPATPSPALSVPADTAEKTVNTDVPDAPRTAPEDPMPMTYCVVCKQEWRKYPTENDKPWACYHRTPCTESIELLDGAEFAHDEAEIQKINAARFMAQRNNGAA